MESVETLEKTTFYGRRFTRAQLAQVQETVETFSKLSRNELALTLCEHLNWTAANGSYKVGSCLSLLEELEARGIVALPAKRQQRAQVPSAITFKDPEAAIEASLDELGSISLQPVRSAEERTLWKRYVESHHYLGYKRPIGMHLCYFVTCEALQQKLGCVSFSTTAAWTLPPRDKWIGWDKQSRDKLRHLVLCQDRFLIFPWVSVSNLGSKILSVATKQVGDDWVRVHRYRPVLVETFVDTSKFSGATYRAANWIHMGETRGRRYSSKPEKRPSKAIFGYPLQSNWRQCLTEGHQTRSLKKRYRNDVLSSRSRTVGDEFITLWEKVIQLLHEVAAEYDDTWRIRKRVLNSLLLMLLIFRLVSSKTSQSYGTTIDELWDSCDKLKIDLPQDSSVSPSAFCVARKKLDESIFKDANQRILEVYSQDEDRYGWFGHRLFAVDGSKLNLPPKLVAYGYKTPSDESHYPQGLLSCLYQVKSQIPFDFSLTSHTDERRSAALHLNVLKRDDVVVYDRGYFSYAMLHQHCETGIHAIFRLQKSSYSVIREFFAGSQTDAVVDIDPSARAQRDIREQHPELTIVPLKMRLVKYEIAAETYCLGTTLLDDRRYPVNELKDAYHARWGVEELYKVSKRHFVIEDFHAKSERGVRQEVFAHFVLITMSRLFANESDIHLNTNSSEPPPIRNPRTTSVAMSKTVTGRIQTNFKNCIHTVTRSIEELLLMRDRIAAAAHHVFNLVVARYYRERPGRTYPRKSMRPRTKWKPKKTKTVGAAHSTA